MLGGRGVDSARQENPRRPRSWLVTPEERVIGRVQFHGIGGNTKGMEHGRSLGHQYRTDGYPPMTGLVHSGAMQQGAIVEDALTRPQGNRNGVQFTQNCAQLIEPAAIKMCSRIGRDAM